MRWFLFILGLLPVMTWSEVAMDAADSGISVVYHVNESKDPFVIMRNIRNHLNADPSVKIVVVTHGAGINFLLEEAVNATGSLYEPEVQNLVLDGVEFLVCRNTLVVRGIEESLVIDDAVMVRSGVAEVARLQKEEGFVYLKP